MGFYHSERYLNKAGSVFRMTSDLAEAGHVYVAADTETEMTSLWPVTGDS